MASSSIQKAIKQTPSVHDSYPKISGFTILQKLCDGAFCKVYKARQDRLGRLVALKVVPEIPVPPDVSLERFNRASLAYAQVVHPNLPALFESGTRDGFHYSAIEYVHGWTLQHLIKRRKQLSESRAVKVALQIANGLSALHSKSIVHRNLKPKNILVGTDGQVQIAGLGLAKCPPGCSQKKLEKHLDAQTIGTPHYMAPEMIRGHCSDPRSDLYALGITLFTMATGHPPFQKGIPATIMAQHLYLKLPSLQALRPDLSRSYIKLTEKLLEKDPKNRVQTAEEAHRWLKGLSTDLSSSANQPDLKDSNLQKAAIFLSAMGLVLLFGIALLGISYAFETPAATKIQEPSAPALPVISSKQTGNTHLNLKEHTHSNPKHAEPIPFNAEQAAENFNGLLRLDPVFRTNASVGIAEWNRFIDNYPTISGRYRDTALDKVRIFRQLDLISKRSNRTKPHPWIGDEEF